MSTVELPLELDGKLLALLQKEKLDHYKPNFIKEECLLLDDLLAALEDCPDVFETLIPLRIPRARLIRAVTKISEKSKRKEAKVPFVPFVPLEIETKSSMTKKEFEEKEILLEKEKEKKEILARKILIDKQTLMIQFVHVYVSDPSILLASGCQGELRFDWCYIGLKTAKLLLENDKRFLPSFSFCYLQSGVKLLLGEKFQITNEFKEQKGAPFDYSVNYANRSPWTGKLSYPLTLSHVQIDSSVCAFMLKEKANYIYANFHHGVWE